MDGENTITTDNRREILEKLLTKRHFDIVYGYLNEQELRAIDGTEGVTAEDYYYIANARQLIETHPNWAKKISEGYKVKEGFFHDYMEGQRKWLEKEEDLLLLKKNMTQKELNEQLIKDFREHQNGMAYKLYFCFKHGDKVERCQSK